MIAAWRGQESVARSLEQRLCTMWCGAEPIEVFKTVTDDLPENDLRQLDAILLVPDATIGQQHAFPLLAAIEDAGVATLAIRTEQAAPGDPLEFAQIPSLPAECPDETLCALIWGLLLRQRELKQLRTEIVLAQRFHGGLEGEIARIHDELQLAALVQREFLPREMPLLHQVEVAALWRPANYVSGDIYDVMRLDEDHIGVFLADAVGHGVPAALMTMIICRSLHTKVTSGSSYSLVQPSEVLTRLNREMIRRQAQTTRFATATYALVNCRTREITIASAGHPPPILLRDGQPSLPVETVGGLLGVFADEEYHQADLELRAHDRLLFYSDGFEQAFPSAEADTYERRLPSTRYREEFDRLIEASNAQEMVDMLRERVDDQCGSLHQVDDLTLLCLHAAPLTQGAGAPAAQSIVNVTHS